MLPDPRDRDPACDCGSEILSGYDRCVECEVGVRFDRDEPSVAREIGAEGGLTPAQIEAIGRVRLEYRAWAAQRNAAAARPACKDCGLAMRPEDRGQWRKSLCGNCEDRAVRVALGQVA